MRGISYMRRRARGFGLMEAMVATVFTGIALAGAFSLSNASRTTTMQSGLRTDLSMLASDIYEHIRADRENADDYAMSLALTSAQCAALSSDLSTSPKQRRYSWCSRLDALSPYDGAHDRRILVDAPDSDTRLITVILQGGAGASMLPAEVVAKRFFDIPGG